MNVVQDEDTDDYKYKLRVRQQVWLVFSSLCVVYTPEKKHSPCLKQERVSENELHGKSLPRTNILT